MWVNITLQVLCAAAKLLTPSDCAVDQTIARNGQRWEKLSKAASDVKVHVSKAVADRVAELLGAAAPEATDPLAKPPEALQPEPETITGQERLESGSPAADFDDLPRKTKRRR